MLKPWPWRGSTGANDVAAVKVTFSDDGGRSFDVPVRIDRRNPVEPGDLEMLDDGTALVSWVEWTEDIKRSFFAGSIVMLDASHGNFWPPIRRALQ